MKSFRAGRSRRNAFSSTKTSSIRRSLHAGFEPLEQRCLLAVTSVGIGAPVLVPFYDAGATASTTFTAHSSNSAITATVLETSLMLKMQVRTYDSEGEENRVGEMKFLLLDDYAPKNIAHFVELVNSGFYASNEDSGLLFHRIMKDFMIQTGSYYGDGYGGSGDQGEYGAVQDDEFHADLRFTSSGLLAMANGGPDSNDSQIFITSLAQSHLDYQYTIFGKLVAGDDMRKAIENVEVEDNGNGEISSPLYPPQIVSCEIVENTQYGLVMLKAANGATANLTSTITVSASNGSSVTLTASDGSQQASLTAKTASFTPSIYDRPAFINPIPALTTTMNQPVSIVVPTVLGDAGVPLAYDAYAADPAEGAVLEDIAVSASGNGPNNGVVTVTPSNDLVGVYGLVVGVRRDSNTGNNYFDSQITPLFIRPQAPGFLSSPNVSDGGSIERGNVFTLHVDGLTEGLETLLYMDGITDPIDALVADASGLDFYLDTSDLPTGTYSFTVKQVYEYEETLIGNAVVPAGVLFSDASANTFDINVTSHAAPVAALDAASITIADDTATFSIAYSQSTVAIDAGSIDGNDIRVTGPNGYSQLAALVDYTPSNEGKTLTARYRVTAPDEYWQSADVGSYTIAMQGGQVDDALGEFVAAGTLGSFSIGDMAPTVTINQAAGQADPTNGTSMNFTVVFSAPVTGFTTDDLVFSGTAIGTPSVLITPLGELGITYNTTYNVALAGLRNGTVIATVVDGAATDIHDRASKASTSTDNTITHDNVRPTVALTHDVNQADPTSDAELSFKAVFSEPVTDFTAAKVIVGGTSGGSIKAITHNGNNNYTILVSGMTNSGVVTLTITDSSVHDVVGNGNEVTVSASVNYALPEPTVTINQASTQADPTNQSQIHFTVVFNVPVTGFTGADVNLSGTAPGARVVDVTGSGTTYDVVIGGMTASGTVTVAIPAGVAYNADGIENKASTGTDRTVTYDLKPLLVTVEQASGQSDPGNTVPLDFLVSFSETVTDFTADDVVISSTTTGNLTAVVSGSGKTYHVKVSGMTSNGSVSVSLPAGKVHDAAGNANLASTSSDNTIYYDMTRPDVVISRAAGQSATSNASVLHFTAVFSEPVVDFAADDVTIGGSAPGALVATVTGSGTTYDIAISGMMGNGTVTVSIPANRVHDADGSLNTVSTGSSRTVTYDRTIPTVTINQYINQIDPTSDSSIDFLVNFSEPVAGLTADDILIGGTAPGSLKAKITGANSTYHVFITGMTGNGTVTASVKAGAASDDAGNANVASTSTDNSVQFVAPPKSFTITAPTSGTYQIGKSMIIRWNAAGALPGSTINLCLDADRTWNNGNEHWFTMDQIAAANGSDSYTWNISGVGPGSYYLAGYMFSGGVPVFSRIGTVLTVQTPPPATFKLTAPTTGTFSIGQTVPITWTAGQTSSGAKVSLCYDSDTTWNGNEKWIEVDQVAASNGSGSYVWNTAGAAPGKYYVGGYIYSGGNATFSRLTQPVTLVGATFSLSNAAAGTYAAGQNVTIAGTAGNVAAGSKISLCYDPDTSWNGNEKWIEVDQLSAVNGTNTYSWNTTSVAPGTYYVAGYLWSGGRASFARSSQTTTIVASPFALTIPAVQSVAVGQNVPIQWNVTGSVPTGSKISLCYDSDTVFNGNEKWIAVDKITASKGAGSYVWNTAGVAPGSYYLAGYLYDGAKMFAVSHLSQPVIVGPTFTLNNPSPTSYRVGESVTVRWTATNTPANAKISLCYDTDTAWNGNETWIEIDKLTAADGAGSYTWSTTGVAPATYYLAGYMYDGHNGFTLSRTSQPLTLSAALTVAAAAIPGEAPGTLTEQELEPLAAEAVRRLAARIDADASRLLASVRLELADLEPGRLGETSGNTIRIDRDAAGYGWFVDATPSDDSEFTYSADSQTTVAADDSPAARRVDLLTAVMHELGHVLGHDDNATGDLMDATLPLGVRRAVIDELFASLRE